MSKSGEVEKCNIISADSHLSLTKCDEVRRRIFGKISVLTKVIIRFYYLVGEKSTEIAIM